jgi:hypothetical protein
MRVQRRLASRFGRRGKVGGVRVCSQFSAAVGTPLGRDREQACSVGVAPQAQRGVVWVCVRGLRCAGGGVRVRRERDV